MDDEFCGELYSIERDVICGPIQSGNEWVWILRCYWQCWYWVRN